MTKQFYFSIGLSFVVVVAFTQQAPDYGQLKSKRLIDKIEFIGGRSLNFPNDHGWFNRIEKESQGLIEGSFKLRAGYLGGVGIIRQMGKHFEFDGRAIYEERG